MYLYVLSAVIGYLIGSLSISVLICRILYNKDVREKGSGNAGATNAARVFGPVAGALTFFGDFLKGIVAMQIGFVFGEMSGNAELGMLISGFFCLLGHCFPLYFKFKGGKAVSTSAAVFLMIDWRIFVIAISLFALIALITKRVSVGSIAAILAAVALTFVFGASISCRVMAVVIAVLVLVMHRVNIKRIVNGTESEFVFGNSNPSDRGPQ